LQQLIAIFTTVFLAELGDKTQMATALFAAEGRNHPVMVFVAASLALVAATVISVLLGTLASRFAENVPLKLIAGLGFVAIGLWNIWDHFKA